MEFARAILKEASATAPKEFQLLPAGEIIINGEAPAWLDEAAAQAIIAAFKARGNDMVIDYEHQTLQGGEAPAAGWIKDLVWRGAEGLWAVAEWTDRAVTYLKNREYRYFSPVFWIVKAGRTVAAIDNVALTNDPKLNNLRPIMAKMDRARTETNKPKEDKGMLEKLRKLLGLADDADEKAIETAVEGVVAKNGELAATVAERDGQAAQMVACKEVMEALGAKPEAGKDEVIQIVASLKKPGDVAVQLSQQVATLTKELAEIKQNELIQLALKDGKTSPEELDAWGRELAKTAPEQFTKIVLSRPAGSVIPLDHIRVDAKKGPAGGITPEQAAINELCGVDEATFKKYNA